MKNLKIKNLDEKDIQNLKQIKIIELEEMKLQDLKILKVKIETAIKTKEAELKILTILRQPLYFTFYYLQFFFDYKDLCKYCFLSLFLFLSFQIQITFYLKKKFFYLLSLI